VQRGLVLDDPAQDRFDGWICTSKPSNRASGSPQSRPRMRISTRLDLMTHQSRPSG
jgi:hypothetical protein